jgi:hypothetical protein
VGGCCAHVDFAQAAFLPSTTSVTASVNEDAAEPAAGSKVGGERLVHRLTPKQGEDTDPGDSASAAAELTTMVAAFEAANQDVLLHAGGRFTVPVADICCQLNFDLGRYVQPPRDVC